MMQLSPQQVCSALSSKGYDLLQQISVGPNGSVYTVSSRKDPACDMIAKFLPSRGDGIAEAASTTLRDKLSRLQALSHHAILPYYDQFVARDALVLVHGNCEFGSIEQFAREEDLPEPQLLNWFKDCISALSQSYSAGIVHGDIKPSNILVDQHQHVKLADFGLSAFRAEIGFAMPPARRSFAAPEIVSKIEGSDLCKADIWSLAATFYGFFVSQSDGARRAKVPAVRDGEVHLEFPEDLNPEIKELLSKMLSFDPAKRPVLTELIGPPKLAHPLGAPNLEPVVRSLSSGSAARRTIVTPRLAGTPTPRKVPMATAPHFAEMKAFRRISAGKIVPPPLVVRL